MRGLSPQVNSQLMDLLPQRFSALPITLAENRGIVDVHCPLAGLKEVLGFFIKDNVFTLHVLMDLTAVDLSATPAYLKEREKGNAEYPRFEIIYMLFSPVSMHRIRIRCMVREGEKVPSATDLWKGADWPEREVFDLMGVEFTSHPNLRRILMPDNFVGYPLQKDFPVQGNGQDYLIADILIQDKKEQNR